MRAIIIHFMIAYIHPFVDGNGRTARALFYWYMLRKGYWLTEFLSISRVIYRSKKGYEKAYLYTENDDNDIGYFIIYNLRTLD
ncbi:MAG: Fic family protein, partial [Bacteroidales bacterium]|nr:Fic family protein [Bacteroidales bacterium]